MKKFLVLLIAGTIAVFAGVAQADDPDGNIQQAIDLLEAEIAKPPVVTTVTETVTATVTQTVTTTVTTTPPPAGSCTGTNVAPGNGLKAAMDTAPAGTTFCLSAGNYTISAETTVQDGDVVQGVPATVAANGAVTAASKIVGASGVENMFTPASGATVVFRDLDISGAVGDSTCDPDCGRAFKGNGDDLTLLRVRCHDNENQCIGTGGATVHLLSSECDHNGNAEFAAFTETRSLSCTKRVRGGSTIFTEVRDSFIHDNYWGGVWFDFYEGSAVLEGNTITDNGKFGVAWEVSGGFNAADNLIVRENTIQDNGLATAIHPIRGGILCNTCADALIEENEFGGNDPQGAVRFVNSTREWGNIHGVIVRNNALNGDNLSCTTGATCTGNA